MATLRLPWPNYAPPALVTFSLTALLLAIPISSSGKSICAALAIFAILCSQGSYEKIKSMVTKRWCQLTLLLFLMAVLGCFWSPASFKQQLFVLEKYSKLLYLPIFAVGFQNKQARSLGVHAFLVAMVITALLSICKAFNFFPGLDFYADHVFRNHIMTGMMMAFAAYLAGYLFFQQTGYQRIIYGLLVVAFSYQLLFINEGRIGYLLYGVLTLLLLAQTLNRQQAIIAMVFVSASYTVCYVLSPAMQTGIKDLGTTLTHYQENKYTSIGFRIQFHNYAKELFKRHPFIGSGTSSFTYLYAKEKPVLVWTRKLLEPHSQYWLTAVEFGLMGILIFSLFMISLFMAALKLERWRSPAMALIALISIGNLSDSLLFYSGSGYFFIVFMALFLSEGDTKKKSIDS